MLNNIAPKPRDIKLFNQINDRLYKGKNHKNDIESVIVNNNFYSSFITLDILTNINYLLAVYDLSISNYKLDNDNDIMPYWANYTCRI